MAGVTTLRLNIQAGTTDVLYATWNFNIPKSSVASSTLSVGSTVSIKSGATYYNGVDVPDWVEAKKWIVREISGDKVIIDKSTDGANSICSPISSKYLTTVQSTATTTVTDTLDHYEVKWMYYTGNSVWFPGSTFTTTDKIATFTIPKNALKVYVDVKPVAKKYNLNGVDTPYWAGTGNAETYIVENSSMIIPAVPSTPSVSVDGYKLTATLNNIDDPLTDSIEFIVYKDTNGSSTKYSTVLSAVSNRRASASFTLTAGYMFRVCCRAYRKVSGNKYYSEQSPFTEQISTVPEGVKQVKCAAESESSVKLNWLSSTAAKSYEIEYTPDERYFDASSEVQSTTSETTQVYINGIDSGKKWYFRVRAVNNVGKSAWSSIVSTVIGSKPAPPTTWSATSSVMIGDKLKIYWVHNSADSSAQTEAIIRISPDHTGFTTIPLTFEPSDDDETTRIYSHEIDLSEYPDGTQLGWRVCTKGIHAEFSDWSERQSVTIYAPPTLELHIGENMSKWIWDTFNFDIDTIYTAATGEYLCCLPYAIRAIAGPDDVGSMAQVPMSYHISIVARTEYEVDDPLGPTRFVPFGTEVYSKVVHTSNHNFYTELKADDITLENNQVYTITVTVTMSSGLTASASDIFRVRWLEVLYEPDARVTIDKDTLSANITPFCLNEYGSLENDVVLSVYRREYDGDFVEIATNLTNDGVTTVVDPHPALDYARYRIVARNKYTNVTGYEDIPGIPVNEPGIVIQWDEDWVAFNHTEENRQAIPTWSGSRVRLLYNVDVSENYEPDASLIQYIGRKNPVTYYGTQKGQTATWSTVIPKRDTETLYAIRRLADWSGDVYVRESSGLGYWARVTVSIATKHKDTISSVSLNVTRVEGGI